MFRPAGSPDLVDPQDIDIRIPVDDLTLGGKILSPEIALVDLPVDLTFCDVQRTLPFPGKCFQCCGHEVSLTYPGLAYEDQGPDTAVHEPDYLILHIGFCFHVPAVGISGDESVDGAGSELRGDPDLLDPETDTGILHRLDSFPDTVLVPAIRAPEEGKFFLGPVFEPLDHPVVGVGSVTLAESRNDLNDPEILVCWP